jgi:acetyl esterase/lipase
MPTVTVVHPRGETTRDVSDLAALNAYVINRGWSLQSGDYAAAYLALTGQPYAAPTAGTATATVRAADNLALAGYGDSLRSTQASAAAYTDAAGWSEAWTDMTAWAAGAGVALTGTEVASTGANTTDAGASRALPAGARVRFRATLIKRATGGSGLVGIGFTTVAAGTKPTSGTMAFVGFDASGFGAVWNKTGVTQLTSGAFPVGTYYVTGTVDDYAVSLVLTQASGLNECRFTVPRATFGTVGAIALWNSDTRGVAGSGSTIGPVAARGAPVTSPVRSLETPSPSVFYGLPSAADQTVRVALPAGYDSRIPAPVVLYAHGSGQTATAPTTDGGGVNYASLAANGFIVASSDQHGINWGSQAGADDLVALYRYVIARHAIGPVLLYGQSMGGLSSLQTLAGRRIPGIAGWLGIYPATNLRAMFDGGTYTQQIKNAHGIAQDGSDYATKTAGRDPQLMDAGAFRGVPMRFYASPGDTQVPKASNTDLFAAKVAPLAPEATVVTTTGDHGDASNFQPADMLAFFQRCLAQA